MALIVNTGNNEVLQQLEASVSSLADLTDLFREIATVLESQVHVRFDTKRDPDGVPWARWAPSTAKDRQKKGFTPGANLMQLHNPGMRDTVTHAFGKAFASVTMAADYAEYHEQPNGPGKGILPRRAMIFGAGGGLGSRDEEVISQTVVDYLNAVFI